MLLCCRDLCGILATLHVATLQRSPLVSLLRYMLLRCRDLLWYPCYVTFCYAAEISGILATLHVATLQRSLVSLLRYMLLRCEFVKDVQRGGSTIKCHTGTIDAVWTSCKQFIPNSLGARHEDVMLYAKMWQWRFISKYKKLLEKTAETLRMIE